MFLIFGLFCISLTRNCLKVSSSWCWVGVLPATRWRRWAAATWCSSGEEAGLSSPRTWTIFLNSNHRDNIKCYQTPELGCEHADVSLGRLRPLLQPQWRHVGRGEADQPRTLRLVRPEQPPVT